MQPGRVGEAGGDKLGPRPMDSGPFVYSTPSAPPPRVLRVHPPPPTIKTYPSSVTPHARGTHLPWKSHNPIHTSVHSAVGFFLQ